MVTLREAARQALEALEATIQWDQSRNFLIPYRMRDPLHASIIALRQAIEAERQEPAEFYDWWTLRPSLTRLQAYLLWREEVDAEIRQALAEQQAEPVAGVVLRDGLPTLLRDSDIKATDVRLCTHPQQADPVAWIDDGGKLFWKGDPLPDGADLYAHPQPAQQPLTDAQRRQIWRDSPFRGNGGQIDWFIEGTRAAEIAHGIK